MSFPSSLETRTVKGRFVTYPDGVLSKDTTIRIVLDDYMQGPTDEAFVAPFDKTFNGEFSIIIPVNDDPQWTPSNYRVVITTDKKVHREKFQILTSDPNPVDLAIKLNIPLVTPGESYIVASAKGVPGGVASLGLDGYVVPSQLPPGSSVDVSWEDIQDKPEVFPHDEVTYSQVTGKPTTFPPSTHGHSTSDVSGLDGTLASKASSSDLTSGLAGKAAAIHTHTIAQVIDLDVQLDSKQNVGDYVTVEYLNGQDLVSYESLTEELVDKADLVGGVIPTSQLPSISVIDFLGSTASQAAMLALTGQKGDWTIRTDLGQSWIITGSNPTQLASWTAMPLANVPVQTVNGQTGTVVLGKADVGLENVDNTSDTAKPVSTPQQTALNLKAPLASPTFTGTVAGITASMVGLPNVNNTSDAAKPISTATALALAGFISPSDHGFCGWTFCPDQVQAGLILPTAGLSYVVRIRVLTTTVSAINVHITVAGNTMTNAFATLHTDAGVYLSGAVTADQSTPWATGGYKAMALTTPQSGLTAGAFYKVRFWVGSATTMPTLSRGVNSSTAITNAGLSAPNFRYATADTGLTTVALAPTTIGTMTGGPTAWWVSLTA